MAGAGKPGPPAKGGMEEVEWQLLKADLVRYRHQGCTFEEIGTLTGYTRSAVGKMMKRIFRELLEEAGAEEVRANEMARLEKITKRMEPMLIPEDEDVRPNLKAVETYLRVSKMKSDLVGAFSPKQLDITVRQVEDDEADRADEIASATERFMELADKIAEAGYGSGRQSTTDDRDIVDAEVVEDSDEDGEPRALGPGDGDDETTDLDEDWSESDDEEVPPNGYWHNGKFVPNLTIVRGLDDNDLGMPPPSWSPDHIDDDS